MQGIADLRDVAYAVLEPDGSLSFVLKDGPKRQRPAGTPQAQG